MTRREVEDAWVTCRATGKRGYMTRSAAKKARQRTHAKSIDNNGALSVYRCASCELWHIGHMPKALRNGTIDRETYRNSKRRGAPDQT